MLRDLLAEHTGQRLDLDPFTVQFDIDLRATDELGMWKLERAQTFIERRSPSWCAAMLDDDWATALAWHEAQRDELRDRYADLADLGVYTHRVRIAELPLTRYMHWELPALRLRAEAGAPCRVLTADRIAHLETHHTLPELVVTGSRVLYEINYDADGLQLGGTRYTDPDLISRCARLIKHLYFSGEGIAAFVGRHCATPPPALGT
ncbi:hypothetical protein GCM10010174_03710 [Kutzneria viridogrisea]|uniref:DUF6879 domain-containing protein n=1 Tax=Kutzneria viridogrisea TaxID=47990 RepID=A0ABR6BRC7_9PSEU|nr:hypothetical protein [Kutzneria viridogrisea]